MKVAIVHDWLTIFAGSERVLEAMLELFPEADLFSLVDFLKEEDRYFIHKKKVHTSFLQKIPFARRFYRSLLPLMPLAIEQFDLSSYDLIISSSHAVAKGVITSPNQLHICMCYSPMRYAWDLQHQYLKESGLDRGITSFFARVLLHKLRLWDIRSSFGVDEFIAISDFIKRRIYKTYRRDSTVIYPPVDVEHFTLQEEKKDFYLAASRLVPYKKMDLIVEAFNEMKDKTLILIGDGPDFKKIQKLKGSNIEMLGKVQRQVVKQKMQEAKAFIFAAIEDFGIMPIEAQASGTPVIAFSQGALGETISQTSGVLYDKQDKDSIIEAVTYFEKHQTFFTPQNCRLNALRFSKEKFKSNLSQFIQEKIKIYENITACRW